MYQKDHKHSVRKHVTWLKGRRSRGSRNCPGVIRTKGKKNTNRNEELCVASASASASWPAIDTGCKEGREDQTTFINQNVLKSILNFEQDSTGVVGTGSGSGGAAGGSGDLEVAAGAGCSTTSCATADALEGSALAACPAGSVYPYAIITIVWLYTLIVPM